jgi:hypothetical protein
MSMADPTTDRVGQPEIEVEVVKRRLGYSLYKYKVVDVFRWLPTELVIPIALCEVCGGRVSRLTSRGGFSYFRHRHRLAFLILSEKGGERRYSYNGGIPALHEAGRRWVEGASLYEVEELVSKALKPIGGRGEAVKLGRV